MAIKKSQLYSSIWEACNELRGGMDASQYKDYVLTLLFVRYVSDKYADKSDSLVVIPNGGSFADLSAIKGDPEIGDKTNKVLSKLAEANGLKGVVDNVDFNDQDKLGKGKEMQDRLTKLIAIFENPEFDFSKNKAEGDDLLGDAYEYLMQHFAVESGKSKGQFYTPAEVSRIMAQVLGVDSKSNELKTVYDPACGSGSLLLKVAAQAKPANVTIYGQEKENATAALAILNMWLHDEPTAVIEKGQSTLSNPLFTEGTNLKTFDYVVANPPFSFKSWTNGFDPEHDIYGRFEGFGIPPNKNGDYAFLLHIVKSLKSTGKGAVILPHGVLFRGNSEARIRENLIKRGYIKGIIGLPANLFYGTGIPACVLVIDKENAQDRKDIFMIDASKGFLKDGNKNRLRERDIRRIVDVWTTDKEVTGFSKRVTLQEIKDNEYNLNLPRYIDTSEKEDIQNIEAHLNGGIPEYDIDTLTEYWSVCPSLQEDLFAPLDRDGFYTLKTSTEDLRETILEHQDIQNFKKEVLDQFKNWEASQISYLKSIDKTMHPKAIIWDVAGTLLNEFKEQKLINKYTIYQHLMEYWEEVMQDDAHILTTDEWEAGKELLRLTTIVKSGKNKGKKKVVEGLVGLEGRLVPTDLVFQKYFKQEWGNLELSQQKLAELEADLQNLEQEHTEESGALEPALSDAGNVTIGNINALKKEYKNDPNMEDELKIIELYLKADKKIKAIKKEIKHLEEVIEVRLQEVYPTLEIDEIKQFVVEDKWVCAIKKRIHDEIETMVQHLSGRISDLTERYRQTLPQIEQEVEVLEGNMQKHLSNMGFVWEK